MLTLAGLRAAGRRIGLFTTPGTVVPTATAHAMGVGRPAIALGLQGCSGCPTEATLVISPGAHSTTCALAVGAVCLTATVRNGVYALVGAAATTGPTASPTPFSKTFDSRTVTWPFTLTTWAFMAAVPAVPRFRRAG